jgi:hypothetical protein
MSPFATTGITPWQTALKCTADCQAPRSGGKEYMRHVQACGNPLSNLDSWLWQSALRLLICGNLQSKHCGLPQSTVYIWAWSLACEWYLAPANLHRKAPCLMRHYILTRDFTGVKLICGRFSRPKPANNWSSWHTVSWHYTFNVQVKRYMLDEASIIYECKTCHNMFRYLCIFFTLFLLPVLILYQSHFRVGIHRQQIPVFYEI